MASKCDGQKTYTEKRLFEMVLHDIPFISEVNVNDQLWMVRQHHFLLLIFATDERIPSIGFTFMLFTLIVKFSLRS